MRDGLLQSHPFAGWVDIVKAEETDDAYILSGPIADYDKVDHDGDILTKAGIWSGLELFKNLGSVVDWDHMYAKTRDPKWIVGKGIDVVSVDGAPWLVAKLSKASPLVKSFWDQFKAGDLRLGYSIWGQGMRDKLDPRKIVKTAIQMITISPQPKGYGLSLQLGAPQGMMAIAKSILDTASSWVSPNVAWEGMAKAYGAPVDAFEVALFEDVTKAVASGTCTAKCSHVRAVETAGKTNGVHVVVSDIADKKHKCSLDRGHTGPHRWSCGGRINPAPINKAFTTGNGIAVPGTTGGGALRGQFIFRMRPKRKTKSKKVSRDSALTKALIKAGVPNPTRLAEALADHLRR